MASPLDELLGLDLSRAMAPERADFLKPALQRAEGRLSAYTPMTVEDRYRVFKQIGFRPHGVYMPTDVAMSTDLRNRVRNAGFITDIDQRLNAYATIQDQSAQWETDGIPGEWTGQQGISRCRSRFRVVVFGRRGGKTFVASREAVAVLLARPRSLVWVAAPTMRLTGRCFDMIVQLIKDRDIPYVRLRNTRDEKIIELENGSICEGVSLDDIRSNPGAAVDLVICDEAAQIGYDTFARVIMPPLTDRNGQALFISSWEGDSNYFASLADAAKDASESDPDWAFFEDAAYTVNFYAFPQGRATPALVAQERWMDPADFLEQYGAVRAGARHMVFPQFKETVHVGHYPFDPGHPVVICCDPSGGANAYAVLAIQDYGDHVNVIDEYYVEGAAVEDIILVLDRREWRDNFTEGVLDSAWQSEIERWNRLGWNVFGVPEKPMIEERLPLYRNLLRDPGRYHLFHVRLIQDVLLDWGMDPALYDALDPKLERRVQIEIEERLARPTAEDTAILKDCARIFFNKATCPYTIDEHKHYVYRTVNPRGGTPSVLDKPRKAHDHGLDALGYWTWTYKRFFWEGQTAPGGDRDLLVVSGLNNPDRVLTDADRALAGLERLPPSTAYGFLAQMRDRTRGHAAADSSRSYLKSF